MYLFSNRSSLRRALVAPAALALAAGVARGQTAGGDLERAAAVIRPASLELKWRQIPWLLDLAAGIRTARQEGRPIFLWVTGDDPLERC